MARSEREDIFVVNTLHGLLPRPSILPATRLELAREVFIRKAVLEQS